MLEACKEKKNSKYYKTKGGSTSWIPVWSRGFHLQKHLQLQTSHLLSYYLLCSEITSTHLPGEITHQILNSAKFVLFYPKTEWHLDPE